MKNPTVVAGLLIGVLCAVWTFVMGATGWYKDPSRVHLFVPVVTLIEIAVLLWGLRRTAALGRTYSGQVVAGTMMSLIAGVVIVSSSLVFTTVFFPDYFSEINAMSRDLMTRAGRSEAEIERAIADVAPMQTPLGYAFAGFVGTFVTGVVATAIIAIWVRARAAAPDAHGIRG